MDKTLVERVSEHIRRAGQPWLLALRLFAFWLLFFAFFRAFFIAWLHAHWSEERPWMGFWHALPLDLSMAGYLALVPLLLYFLNILSGPKPRVLIGHTYTGFQFALLLLLVAVFGANVFVYAEWHTPLNSRAFDHFRISSAMLDSMSTLFKIGSVMLFVGLVSLWWRALRGLVGVGIYASQPSRSTFFLAPVLFFLVFFAIRGGGGKMPINESAVYYSGNLFYNHAATNAGWHFFHSLIEARSTENKYKFTTPDSAKSSVEQLFSTKSAAPRAPVWTNRQPEKQPNVVFILMESMTVQVVEELGGVPGVCPNLGRLAQQGLLFEHCYGSGYRTDQGLVSILAGFPAQPDQSIVLLQDKAAKLPALSKSLRQEGYATSFFYGGQLTFANIGVWLRYQQFDQIVSIQDFPGSEITQRWGADDSRLFQKALKTFEKTPQPFFSTIMTLSLHQPYDVPYTSKWNGKKESDMFLNSAAFADYAIGEFFRQAEKMPWFANTIFVLVADHGHPQPGNLNMDTPRARQVPLIITGPMIKPEWRGRRISKIGNHHDIPATILRELGYADTSFSWSQDLLNSSAPGFAYYSNENGLGWVTPQGSGFFNFAKNEWRTMNGAVPEESKVHARAYLQVLYDEFLGL